MRLLAEDKQRLLSLFSANLQNYRKTLRLSQEQFGDQIGISRQTVSSIERGAYPLNWSTFLSCLLVCSTDQRARKQIFHTFAGDAVVLEFLEGLTRNPSSERQAVLRNRASQLVVASCTIKDDPDYPILEMDASLSAMLWGGADACGSAHYMELVYEADREAVRSILSEKLRREMVVCLEHRVLSVEGEPVMMQCFIRRQKKMMKNGVFEVTMLPVTAETLQKRQISRLIKNLPVGIAAFSYKGKPSRENVPEIYYANDTFYSIIGYTREQLAGIHNNYLTDIIAPHDVREVLRLFDPKHEEHSVAEADFRVNRSDGKMSWVHGRVFVVSRSEESGTFVSCTFTDITERVNAELAMKYQLERYRQVEDASDDYPVGYDVEKDELTLPIQLKHLSIENGVLKDFLKRKIAREWVHPEDYEDFARLCREVLLQGKNGRGEYRVRINEKEYKWYRLSLVAVANADGRIAFIYGRAALIEEEKKIQKESSANRLFINRLTTTDRLTGLYNRAAFCARVQEMLRQPDAEAIHAIVSCDVNDFSYLNEKFGYPAGDRILRDFGAMFLRKGKKCFACRLHSDYFLVYLNAESRDVVFAKIRSWTKVFAEHQRKYFPEIDIQLTHGIYFLKRGEDDLVQAIDNANLARKQAKAEQCKVFCVCTEELRARRSYEQSIAGEIMNAIRDRKIEVFLQPKFALGNREVIGAEALARWKNEDGSYRSPAEFVPILEKTGHISELDFYVYTSVLQTLRRWQKAGVRRIPISVNFSNSRFVSNFDDRIVRLAEQYGVSGQFLELEIDEAILSNRGREMEMLTRLRQLGFRISLNNFGSGSDTLSMLIHAPVNSVKIRKSFLENIGNSERERDYVRCMCEMIASVKKEAVFAGVETEQQEEFLSNCGFTKAQGYLFERPIPIPQFEQKYLHSPAEKNGIAP